MFSRQLNLEPWAGHHLSPQGFIWLTPAAASGGLGTYRRGPSLEVQTEWLVWAQVPPERQSLWLPPSAPTAGSSGRLFEGGLCGPAPLLCHPLRRQRCHLSPSLQHLQGLEQGLAYRRSSGHAG